MNGSTVVAAEPSVTYNGDVGVLNLGSGEGRFNLESITAIEDCLAEILKSDCKAMVTISDSKIWSNGFDIDWLRAHPDRAGEGIRRTEEMCARFMTTPIPTVAVLGGHAFAGGVFLALAHDVRIMRVDRGYVCLPEADMGVVFTPGMFAQMRATVPPATVHRAMAFGHRFTADEAVSSGLVHEAVELDGLLARGLEIAKSLAGKDRATLAEIKQNIYADALAVMGAQPPSRQMLESLGVQFG